MSEYAPRILLVTGGAGFIGSHVVESFLASDPDLHVITLDALTYAGSLENLRAVSESPRHSFVRGDVADLPLVAALLRERRVDTIVHLAAESHVDRSIAGPAPFVHTNVVGTYVLLEAARVYWAETHALDPARCRFHLVSTDEVYGSLELGDAPVHASSPYRPSSPYAASKAAADHLALAYHRTYGLPVTVTHGSNAYGPRQHAEKLIPVIAAACAERRAIPLYGDGLHVRDWLYVTDHAQAIARAVQAGRAGATYLVGGGEELANVEVARRVCRLFDERRPGEAPHEGLIGHVADRPGHDRRYAMDATATRRELGWAPAVAFDDGLREALRSVLG